MHNKLWDNPLNWSPNGVPLGDAVAVIDGSAPASPDNTSLGSVAIHGLTLSGGSLNTSGMLIDRLIVSGGTVYGGSVNINTNGAFNWSGGSLAVDYQIFSGASMSISGSSQKVLLDGSVILNQRTISWLGGAPVTANANQC